MRKILICLTALVLATPAFAADDFKSEDFLKVLKAKRNLLKDYQLKPYVVNAIKYQSTYVSSEGEGFYLQVRNEDEVAKYPKKDNKGESTKIPDFTEQWGPYKTNAEAEAAKAGIPKESSFTVVRIVQLEGAYSTKWYTLQESLYKDDDRALTGCYQEQVKEFEKTKSDDTLGRFIHYLNFETVKIQILDLRKGAPRENPSRDLFGYGDFTVSATLDAANNCKITRVADIKDLFKAHIEHHKKLLTANFADMDAEKRISRRKILGEFQDRLKLQVDMIRNPENFRIEPKAPLPKKTSSTKS